MEWVETFVLPTGFVGAAAAVVITLIKFRSTDREALSASQKAHMDRLTKERVEADERADRLQQKLDEERLHRAAEELRAQRAEYQVELQATKIEHLTQQVEHLTEQVRQLTTTVEHLNHQIADMGATG